VRFTELGRALLTAEALFVVLVLMCITASSFIVAYVVARIFIWPVKKKPVYEAVTKI
jgi:predicted permease